jgi:hypothetical protein
MLRVVGATTGTTRVVLPETAAACPSMDCFASLAMTAVDSASLIRLFCGGSLGLVQE